jgi:hypothetical protein
MVVCSDTMSSLEKREFGKNENSINLNDRTLQDLQYIYCTTKLTLEVRD